MKKRHSFGKHEKLRKSFEFKKARDSGTTCRGGVFILNIAHNNAGCHRLGLSIGSAKIPLAVGRNRVKRLIREVFRLNKSCLKGGPYDIVVAMKRALGHKTGYANVEQELLALLKQAKAL